MDKKTIAFLLATFLLALVHLADAQQPNKVSRIAYLGGGSAELEKAWLDAFLQGLQELGYFEGKNIVVERRFAAGRYDELPELVAELVRLKVDVILAASTPVAHSAKKITTTIPIVMANAGDPIGNGLVASLARPGGNVTGLTNQSPKLLGKRLELLNEVVPKVSRVALLIDAASIAERSMFKDAQQASQLLGVKLQSVEVKAPNPDLVGRIPSYGQGAHWRCHHSHWPAHRSSPNENYGAFGTESYASDSR